MAAYPSQLLEKAVDELSRLPGIGKKTALRFCLYLLRQPEAEAEALGEAIKKMRQGITYCPECHNMSDGGLCPVCSDHTRDKSTLCIVESVRDVMAIENTTQYRGVYHVLGGVISPMEGIGPSDLHIHSLTERVEANLIKEFIMALPATLEGDTTSYYLFKKLSETQATFTTIARGIAIGDELEYTDEITLGRSILNRVPYMDSQTKTPKLS
jgi:recombination protein RecR